MKMDDCVKNGLLIPHTYPWDTVLKEFENANKHLENAERSHEYGMIDLSIVSSYTAMFHAARALLFMDGFKERSHVCLVTFLRERYPNLKEFTNIFDIYRKNRHESLYGIDYRPLNDDSICGIDSAKRFIEVVKEMIKEASLDDQT